MKTPFSALLCALSLCSIAATQSDPPAEKPEKLAAWPELKQADKDRLLPLVGQLRKDDPELRAAGAKQLRELGAGGAPLLFQQVSDRPENVNAQLFAVFDDILDASHASLMAVECKKPRVELRRYLIKRLCKFADPDMVPVLKASVKDKDELTSFYASLGLLATKQREAVAPVLAYTKLHWKEVGEFTAEVLPAARSDEVGTMLWEAIASAQPADQMAGLRLLRYVAPKSQASMLRKYLEATDHTVKKEAVNTARVLHGEAPLENLPVFQAIEMSKQWLQKL